MDFEKAKKLLKESIDEGANLFEIMEIFTDKVYEQGKQDGKDSEQVYFYSQSIKHKSHLKALYLNYKRESHFMA